MKIPERYAHKQSRHSTVPALNFKLTNAAAAIQQMNVVVSLRFLVLVCIIEVQSLKYKKPPGTIAPDGQLDGLTYRT